MNNSDFRETVGTLIYGLCILALIAFFIWIDFFAER